MSIDKAKIEQAAAKYIQKGQFPKAIAEFQKIISSEPKDLRIRIKLLDLYAREGMKREVVEESRRITSTYIEQGFVPRAIAIWKQALRVDAENADIYTSLGELYIEQRLVGDAIVSFKKAVDSLRKNKRYGEAARLLRRMEELAPDNAAIKVHLAETYLDMGETSEFSSQLRKVMDQLRAEGRTRKLLQTLEELYERAADKDALVKPLIETYLELGDDDKAIVIIRQGLSQDPRDLELRVCSVRANLALGNIIDAHKVAMGIRDEDPDNLFILEQLVSIARARGDQDELVHWYKEFAKTCGRRGDREKEDYLYRKVLELVPEDAEARLAVGDLGKPLGKEFEGMRELGLESFEEKGTMLDEGDFFIDFGEEAAPRAKAESTKGEPRLMTEVEEGIVEADLLLKYGLEDNALARLKDLVISVPDNHAVRAKLRDLYWRRGDHSGWLAQQNAIARIFLENDRPNEALRAFESVIEIFPDNEEAKSALARLRGEPKGFFEPTAYAMLDEELDRIDGLIADRDTGEAVSALLRLQENNPDNSEISSRLADLGWVTSEEEAVAEMEANDEFADIKAELGDIDFDVSSIAGFEEVEVSELDDILKEFKSGVAEKLEDGDYDTHYDLGMAYKEMGLLEDALHEFQRAAKYVEKAKNAYTSMAMIYRETGHHADARGALRMALSVASNSQEDRAAILYELGQVSEEEGDWEGAVNSYEKVLAIDPGHRDVGRRLALAKERL